MQVNLQHADDLRLKEQILRGDREAAESFFGRHIDSLYEFVFYRVGGNSAVAEDLLQDTLLAALEKLAAFEGRSSLHTWLCAIAKNKIRSHRRKRRPIPLDQALEEADSEIEAALLAIDTRPLPDEILELEETRDLVGATLSCLPPDYRKALLSKYVEEIPVAEMASREGRGLKATESHLHRARVAFSKVFQILVRRRGGLP